MAAQTEAEKRKPYQPVTFWHFLLNSMKNIILAALSQNRADHQPDELKQESARASDIY
jgi:hypothetical protein